MKQESPLTEKSIDSLPWQRAYSFILARDAEYLDNAPSIGKACELLALLRQKLSGLTLNECVRIGRYDYMLIHYTIVRSPSNRCRSRCMARITL
jgi:hypothetical protein